MTVDTSCLGLVLLGVTTLINVALATMAGCIGSLWMLRHADTAWAQRRMASTFNVLRAGALGYLLAAGMLLWVQAAVMTERPLVSAAPFIGQVASTTQVGHSGLTAAVAALTLLLASFLLGMRRHVQLLVLAGGCFVVIAATRSWAGHAGASGHLVPAVIDWLHVLGVTAWAGVVFLAAFFVLRGTPPAGPGEQSECANAVQALSTIATWSLGLVVLTGFLSAWRVLGGSLSALLTSTYGELLLIKLCLVAIAAALGAHNRLLVLKPLLASLRSPLKPSSASALRVFNRVLIWESLMFVAALGLAAALGMAPPPELH